MILLQVNDANKNKFFDHADDLKDLLCSLEDIFDEYEQPLILVSEIECFYINLFHIFLVNDEILRILVPAHHKREILGAIHAKLSSDYGMMVNGGYIHISNFIGKEIK
jgi:hypothetical protein